MNMDEGPACGMPDLRVSKPISEKKVCFSRIAYTVYIVERNQPA